MHRLTIEDMNRLCWIANITHYIDWFIFNSFPMMIQSTNTLSITRTEIDKTIIWIIFDGRVKRVISRTEHLIEVMYINIMMISPMNQSSLIPKTHLLIIMSLMMISIIIGLMKIMKKTYFMSKLMVYRVVDK